MNFKIREATIEWY